LETDRFTQEHDVPPALQEGDFRVPAIADLRAALGRRNRGQRDDIACHRYASPPSSCRGSGSGVAVSPLSASPSTVMNTVACGHSSRFTQIADATAPVRVLTPCHTPPAGRLSPRLTVT